VILPLASVVVAAIIGLVVGGSFRGFPDAEIRSWWLAIAGLLLQVIPAPSDLAYVPLVVSFVVLLIFVGLNIGTPGFILLLVGVGLNLLVISSNLGMPVTRDALRTAGLEGSTAALESDTKHRLATEHTVLRPLGDAIGVPPPIAQVVSPGDLCMYVGLAWFVIAAMPARPVRGRRKARVPA
jgi:hypothetical protein